MPLLPEGAALHSPVAVPLHIVVPAFISIFMHAYIHTSLPTLLYIFYVYICR